MKNKDIIEFAAFLTGLVTTVICEFLKTDAKSYLTKDNPFQKNINAIGHTFRGTYGCKAVGFLPGSALRSSDIKNVAIPSSALIQNDTQQMVGYNRQGDGKNESVNTHYGASAGMNTIVISKVPLWPKNPIKGFNL